ncbi:hypothetical protein [Staphylococcus haemolyticus]|uniref:hypothetical protein n=1 Tax=Staphylococcus haemolyticus TaxID=1283 RepID=UPI0015D6ED72|nr:hypothetical protein [Staphylococcus haemolyticus]
MEIDLKNPVIAVYASMKIFRAQAVPGTLSLLKDRIYFQARGVIEGSEIKNTFLFSDIKSIKSGISFSPYRVVITENNGEKWIFDQVPRQDAKKFVELFYAINES